MKSFTKNCAAYASISSRTTTHSGHDDPAFSAMANSREQGLSLQLCIIAIMQREGLSDSRNRQAAETREAQNEEQIWQREAGPNEEKAQEREKNGTSGLPGLLLICFGGGGLYTARERADPPPPPRLGRRHKDFGFWVFIYVRSTRAPTDGPSPGHHLPGW
jgi:hypothetical protein